MHYKRTGEFAKVLDHLFSPLGKPADRARPIYFVGVNFFFFLFYYEQSYLSIYRFLRSLHQMECICVYFLDHDWCSFSDYLRDIAMATNFVS